MNVTQVFIIWTVQMNLETLLSNFIKSGMILKQDQLKNKCRNEYHKIANSTRYRLKPAFVYNPGFHVKNVPFTK